MDDKTGNGHNMTPWEEEYAQRPQRWEKAMALGGLAAVVFAVLILLGVWLNTLL